MKTEQLNTTELYAELQAICRKYGVAMIPTCPKLGEYGQIEFVPMADITPDDRERIDKKIHTEHVTSTINEGKVWTTHYTEGIA